MRFYRVVWCLLAAVSMGLSSAATTPASAAKRAFFAVDSVAHSAFVSRIVATPDERHLVTVSNDKSIRIWDAQTGTLLKRWVMPVNDYSDGELFSLALSPDGEWAAVSGAVRALGKDFSVAIVSLRDGSIRRVIPGFTSIIWSLAWSPDGRFLALGLGDDGPGRGFHVFEAESGKRVFTERNVDARVANLGFRQDNALFAVTHNPPSQASLYVYRFEEGNFVRTGSKSFGDKGGFRAYWSHDGKAVYVRGHTYIQVDGLVEPPHPIQASRRGGGMPSLMGLRESPDGKFLFGAAFQVHETTGKILRWSLPKTGWFEDVTIPDPRVTDIVALRDGSLAYVTDTGVVGAIGSDLRLKWRNARQLAAISGQPERLRVSKDESWISLPVDAGGKTVDFAFNLFSPGFMKAEAVGQSWQAPEESRRGMKVMTWKGTLEPTLNDLPFPKVTRERSLSVAVHSTENALVFGSNGNNLRKVDATGKAVWRRYLFSEVAAVNLLESKQIVVAATTNGFVHLVRWSNGELLASYYLEPGTRRWLAMSPAGKYETSIGAEDLAGWIVGGNARRMADFYPLSRFRSERWQEGLVRQIVMDTGAKAAKSPVIATGEAGDAIAAALEPTASSESVASVSVAEAGVVAGRLPPVVDILSPGFEITTADRQLKVRYRVRSPDEAPVTSVRTRVVSASMAQRGLKPKPTATEANELVIDLPAEESEVEVIAESAWGTSVPARIRVRRPVAVPVAPPVVTQGALHVVVVGVSDYDRADYRLALAAKDAADFARAAQAQEGKQYGKVNVVSLLDKQASRSSIESALSGLRQMVQPQDTTIVFLAGHGINDASGEYFYLPRDAQVERLGETGLSFKKVGDDLASLPGRTVMFVDTCHSGNVISRLQPGQSQNSTRAINELTGTDKNIVVFASSTGGQLSLEDSRWGNGAFTKAVVEGLGGKADLLKRGRVTYKQLDAYVSDRVEELTEGKQTPVTPVLVSVPDFVLALTR